ncbi:glutathione S-transferase [Collybia nuda]|uniref:glutathione transferase n=1 Tax=Collybia nuda TaxID=64659 RepID=A0A9P5Y064_9AGAR|nr:glutathione S-transferase [Collybia nuda]
MVLKLYGMAISTCTRRVAMVLHEKKVPYELIEVDLMTGAHKQPSYLEKQPFGQVPCIDDDGFILYESRAICRYIVAKYPNEGPPLVPADPKANALFEQAASVEQNSFDPLASAAVVENIFKPFFGGTPDPEAFKKIIAKLEPKLDVYEEILGKQKYVGGDELTLADLFHLPYGSMLPAAGSDVIEARPNVARWFGELSSRPSWVAVKDGVKSVPSYA